MAKVTTLMLVLLLAAGVSAQNNKSSSGPKKGSLVIVGGGKIPQSISDRFIALAGGPAANFVLIPTALEDEALKANAGKPPELFGLKNLTVLHTRDRKEADSKQFIAALKKANGVWLGGGRQWRLVDSYLNTAVHKELCALLKRGGVIGGTSAGASIQASFMVRGAREGNQLMMAPGYLEGFGLLRNTAIDQHINTRKREADLKEVIAAHPELLGIGLYESTAIIVQGDKFTVLGDGKVAITDGLDHQGLSYYLLQPGAQFDLRARKPIP
jgi:cyanophycinase